MRALGRIARRIPRGVRFGRTDPAIRMPGRTHGGDINGAGDRNRTGDPVITSDVLYQLSYTSSAPESQRRRPGGAPRQRRDDGATPQNRTGDTRIFSAVLYQLS